MTEKDDVLINDSNLKDFLKQDLEAMKLAVKGFDLEKLDLTPEPIYKKVKKMEEKKKAICTVLGINETRVLKYLNKEKGHCLFEDIYKSHKHYTSMKYPSQLSQLLGRLLRKNLIRKAKVNGEYYFKISKKGNYYWK